MKIDLDSLLSSSDELCSLVDDFVSALDPPQDLSEVQSIMKAIMLIIETLELPFAGAQGKDARWIQTFRKQFEQSITELQNAVLNEINTG